MLYFASDCDGITDNDVATDDIGIGVQVNGTGIAKYSNTQFHSGTSSIFFDPTTAFKTLTYTFPSAPDEVYVRMFLFIEAGPTSGNTVFCKLRNSTTNIVVAQASFNSAGKLRIARSTTNVYVSLASYTGQWVRVEWRVNGGVDQEFRIYAGAQLNGPSDTPTETSGIRAADIESTMSDFSFGGIAASAGAHFYIDDLAIGDGAEGWIGPIEPDPVADFTMNPPTADVFVPIDFNDISTGVITDWSWDFGDGGTSIEQNPTHTYLSDGTYNVTLTVSNRDGTDFSTQQLVITALTKTVLFASSFENGADGALVAPADEGFDLVNGALTYDASLKVDGQKSLRVDGTSSAYGEEDFNGKAQVGFRGYFYFQNFPVGKFVSLVAFRAAGVSLASLAVDKYGGLQIRSGGAPSVLYVRGQDKIVTGNWNRIEARIKPDNIIVQIWPGANRHSPDPAPIRIVYTAPAGSQFPLIDAVRFGAVNASEGAVYNIDTVSIELDWPGPPAGMPDLLGAAYKGPYVAKINKSVQFTDFSAGAVTGWDWDFGDSSAHDSTQNPAHVYATPGTYTVKLVVTDGTNSRNYSREITIYDPADGAAVVNTRVAGIWVPGLPIHDGTGATGRARVYVAAENRWSGNTAAVQTGPRFPGDPGDRKVYMGQFNDGQNVTYYDQEFHPVTGNIAAKSLPSPYTTTDNIRPGVYRMYYQWNSLGNGLMDTMISRGSIPWISWKLSSASQALDIAQGNQDAFIISMANYFKSRSNRIFFWTLCHEPERSTWMAGHPRSTFSDYNTSPNRKARQSYRKAQRRVVQQLAALGVTNATFISCNYTQYAFTDGVRDPWWEFYPDWKGDELYPTDKAIDDRVGIVSGDGNRPGYQGTYYAPNPSDFWSATNDGDRVVDIFGYDLYCFHCKGGNDAVNPAGNMWLWSDTELYHHTLIDGDVGRPNGYHAKTFHDIGDQLNAGMCYGIGEYGYGFKEQEDPAKPGKPITFLGDSLDYYYHMFNEMLDRRVMAVAHWRGVMNPPTVPHWCSVRNTINTIDYDNHDVRRQIFKMHMTRPEAVLPAGFPVWT